MATPNVPGVTYTPISYDDILNRLKTNAGGSSNTVVRNPDQYEKDRATIYEEYKNLQPSLDTRSNQEEDKPLWEKVLTSAPVKLGAKALQYTSGSELAYKIPGIGGTLEDAADYIPGVRTALAVGTNPLTYLSGGTAGLAAAAGAGLGSAAGSLYEQTSLPGAGSGYAPAIGGILGGVAGARVGAGLAASQASRAAASAEADIAAMEAGTVGKGSTLYTADGQVFTPRRPTIDSPDSPLDWHGIAVKDPAQFSYNAADRSYNIVPKTAEGIDQVANARSLGADGVARDIPWYKATEGNPAFDVISEGTKGLRQSASEAASMVQQHLPQGIRTIQRAAAPAVTLGRGIVNPGNIINPTTLKIGAGLGAAGYAASAAGLDPGASQEAQNAQGQQPAPSGFFSKIFDKVGDALAPAIDPYIHAANAVFEHLPQPVQDDISTGAHTYQSAIEKFVTPVTHKIDEISRGITGNTIDPVVYALLPDKVANPLTEAIDFAGSLAPYIALEIVTAGTATPEVVAAVTTAQTSVFAAQGLADASVTWEAYKHGEISTGQFVTSMGMSGGMVVGLAKVGEHARGAAEGRRANLALGERDAMYKDNPLLMRDDLLAGAEDFVQSQVAKLPEDQKPNPVQIAQRVEEYKQAINNAFEPIVNRTGQAVEPQAPVAPGDHLGAEALARPEQDPHVFYAQAVENTKRGGSTFDPNTGTETPMRGRWMAGSDTPGKQVPLDQFSAQDLADYVANNPDFKNPRVNVGTEIVAEDGNHNPLPVEQGGRLFVNIDPVIPATSEAEANAIAATLPGGHVHAPMDARAPGEGGFKDAQGNDVAAPTNGAERIVDATLKNGGTTFDPRTNEPVATDAHLVGGLAPTEKVPAESFTPDAIQKYLADHAELFQRPDVNIGTELVDENGSKVVNIDAVEAVADRNDALQRAAARGEERVWSGAEGKAIVVPGVEQTQVNPHAADNVEGREFIPRDQIIAAPDNPEQMAGQTTGEGRDIGKHTPDGQIVGYPEGVKDQTGVDQMRDTLKQLAEAGKDERYWYEESSHAIIKAMYGVDLGDPHAADFQQKVAQFAASNPGGVEHADKFAQFLAILSAQRKVPVNTNLGLRAWMQKITGTTLHNLNLPDQYAKLETAYRNIPGEDWPAMKTNRFYLALLKHIDPAKYDTMTNGESTIDMWMMRALGYKSDAPGRTQYIAAAREVERLAQELGWSGDQAQAAVWIGTKMRDEGLTAKEAAYHFGTGIEAQTAQLTLVPGKSADVIIPEDTPKSVLADYTKQIHEAIDGDISRELGIPMPDNFVEGEQATHVASAPIGPGGKTARPMVEEHTKALFDGVTALLAKWSGADTASWAAGIALDKHKWAHNGLGVETSRAITDIEAKQITDNLRSQGIDARIEKTKTGFWILNNSKAYDAVDWREVVKTSKDKKRIGQPTEPRTEATYTPERLAQSQEQQALTKLVRTKQATKEQKARLKEILKSKETFGYKKVTDPATVKALAAESKEFAAKAEQVVRTSLPEDVHADLYGMRYDGGTINGNNIDEAIRNSGISEEARQRLEATIQPRIDAVNQQFAAEHGWELRRDISARTDNATGGDLAGTAEAQGSQGGLGAEAVQRGNTAELQSELGPLADYVGRIPLDTIRKWKTMPFDERPYNDEGKYMTLLEMADAYIKTKDSLPQPDNAGSHLDVHPDLQGEGLDWRKGGPAASGRDNFFTDDRGDKRGYPPEAWNDRAKGVYRDAFNKVLNGDRFVDSRAQVDLADRRAVEALTRFNEAAAVPDEFAGLTRQQLFAKRIGLMNRLKAEPDVRPELDRVNAAYRDALRAEQAAKNYPDFINDTDKRAVFDGLKGVGQDTNQAAEGAKTMFDAKAAAEAGASDIPGNDPTGYEMDAHGVMQGPDERAALARRAMAGRQARAEARRPKVNDTLNRYVEKAKYEGFEGDAAVEAAVRDMAKELVALDNKPFGSMTDDEFQNHADKMDAIRDTIDQLQQERSARGEPRLFVPEMADGYVKEIKADTNLLPNATIFEPQQQVYYGNGRYAQHEQIIKTLGEAKSGYYNGLRNLFQEGYVRLESIPKWDDRGLDTTGYEHIETQGHRLEDIEAVVRNLVDVQHLPADTPIYWDITEAGDPQAKRGGRSTLGEMYKPAPVETIAPPPVDRAAWLDPRGKWLFNENTRSTHLSVMEDKGIQPKQITGTNLIPDFIKDGYTRVYLDKKGLTVQAKDLENVRRVVDAMPDSADATPVYYDLRSDKGQDMSSWGFIQKSIDNGSLKPEMAFGEVGKSTVGEMRTPKPEPVDDTAPIARRRHQLAEPRGPVEDPAGPQAQYAKAEQERQGYEAAVPLIEDPAVRAKALEDLDYARTQAKILRGQRYGAEEIQRGGFGALAAEEAAARRTTRRNAAAQREASYNAPREEHGGATGAEIIRAESAPHFKALDNATHRVDNLPLAAQNPEHGPVLDALQQMPAVRDWVRLSTDAVDTVRNTLADLGLHVPEMENIKYGGILLTRYKVVNEGGRPRFFSESGHFNVRDGEQSFVNDPLTTLEAAKQESALASGSKTVSERDAFRRRATDTLFHESIHGLILGHKQDFASVLAEVRKSRAYTDISEQFGQAYDKWAESGQLAQLEKEMHNANRIDDIRYTQPRNERRGVVPNDARPVDAGSGEPRPAERPSDSGTGRPVDQAGQGLGTGVRTGATGTRQDGQPTAARTGAATSERGSAEGLGNTDRTGSTRDSTGGVGADAGTSGTRTVRRPSVKLESNDAYDVIQRFRLSGEKVNVKDGGVGLVFLRSAERAKDAKTFVQPLSDIKDVMTDNFADNILHKAGVKAGEAGGWKKLIAKTLGGKAAIANEAYQKAIVAYHILREEGESRKFLTMNELHQATAPFKEIVGSDGLKTGRVKIKDSTGEEVTAFLGDVFSNPSQFELSAGQKAYIDITHRVIDDLVGEMRAHGVDIKELGIEKRGEHYFPRFVVGQKGFEFDVPYAKNQIGSKQIFEKGRHYANMSEGTAAGNAYAHPLEALEGFIDASNKTIAAKKFLEAIKDYSVTGRELALEQVGFTEREKYNKKTGKKEMVKEFTPLKAASDVARRANNEVKQRTRELEAARRGERDTKIRTDAKMNMAELNKKVNELDSVKKLRARIENAKTERTKTKLGEQLKKLLVSERGKMRRADVKGSDKVLGKTAKIEEAQAALDIAKAKFEAERINLRKTSRDISATIKRFQSAKVADTRLLPTEMVDSLGLAGDIRVKGVPEVPALNGKLFPEAVADAIHEGINDKGFQGTFDKVKTVNDFARLARASTDFGYLAIQGLPVLTRHPVAFGKAMYHALQAFITPEGYAKWLATKKHVTDDMYPFAGGFSGSEYFTATKGNKMKQLADTYVTRGDLSSVAKAGFGKSMQRFAVSFESFLDAAKVSMWEGMMPHLKTRAEKEAYGRLIRNMTGTTSTARLGVTKGQREIEGLLMFSPRFTRSIFALAGQALERGPAQRQAILSIGSLIGGAMIMYTGAKLALGQDIQPEDFNPTSGGRFMSVKVGNNWYGLGGSARGAIQLLGYTVASLQDPKRFFSTDSTSNDHSNPFLKYARGRLSPAASQIADFAAGETVIGQDTTDRKAWLMRLPDQFIPFGVQTLAETEGGTNDKLGGFLANMGGLRTFPEAANEDLNASVRDYANDKSIGKWSDLTSMQKVDLLTKHPDLQAKLDKADMSNWTAYKKVALDAAEAKKSLAAEWLATQASSGGEKVKATDVTSKDYRDRLDAINQRLIGARAALNGANSVTGLGGSDFNAVANTPRQRLMNAYYAAVDKNKFMLPDGSVDWEAKDALENSFVSQLTPEQKAIVQEETAGTSLDPLEKRLKQARSEFKPYWDLRDSIAQRMGYDSALAISQAPKITQTAYNKQLTVAQDTFRRKNPEIDKLLKLWGYTSKTMQEKAAGNISTSSGMKSGLKSGFSSSSKSAMKSGLY